MLHCLGGRLFLLPGLSPPNGHVRSAKIKQLSLEQPQFFWVSVFMMLKRTSKHSQGWLRVSQGSKGGKREKETWYTSAVSFIFPVKTGQRQKMPFTNMALSAREIRTVNS